VSRFRLTPPRVKLVENDVERACLDLLRLHGYYVVRLQSGKFKTVDGRWVTVGEPGLPDYCVIKRDFFVEVKAPGRKLSPAQINKIFELEACGFRVATIDGVERLEAWLREHEHEHEKKAGHAAGPETEPPW
jgi:hypothetical protein